jgi:ferredoxin
VSSGTGEREGFACRHTVDGVDTPFDVLGVDADAATETVERAYRRRVKTAHPDHGGSPGEFQRVRAAYRAILDGDVPDDEDETASWEPAPDRTVDVEYLNYEVLDDHGWTLDDDDLFERAAAADLDPADYGQFAADPEGFLLESAEDEGHVWPFACRGGACANCAVAALEGDVTMTVDHVLPDEMLDRDVRLSCMAVPTTDTLRVVYNVKHLPDLDDLRLPPYPFERSTITDG